MTDTNAGPVLPEAPELRVKLVDTLHMTWSQARECDQNIRADIEAYGRQCAEHVAGPLRERVAELEREEEISDHVIQTSTRMLAELVVILRGPEPPLTGWSYHDIPQLVQALKDDRDRLRAESVIEWEPGRSYKADELLRMVIWRHRVRKGKSLWPAVMSMFGVGRTVAQYLCRWAGRDPDTGATIEGAK